MFETFSTEELKMAIDRTEREPRAWSQPFYHCVCGEIAQHRLGLPFQRAREFVTTHPFNPQLIYTPPEGVDKETYRRVRDLSIRLWGEIFHQGLEGLSGRVVVTRMKEEYAKRSNPSWVDKLIEETKQIPEYCSMLVGWMA